MKLQHLSVASILGSALGVLVLGMVTLSAAMQIRTIQVDVNDLFDFRQRIGQLSAATDNLILQGADPTLAASVRAEADAIKAKLGELGRVHPDAMKVAQRIEMLTAALYGADDDSFADASSETAAPGIEPAPMDDGSRILLSQIVQHGIALDSALDEVLRERRAALASRARSAAIRLVLAALLFGLLCMAAFGLIYWRVVGPVRALTNTVERIGAGDRDARAQVSGRDEIALLAAALNRMLDQRAASAQRLLQYRQLAEGSEDLMAIADEHYRYLLVNDAYATMFGHDPASAEGAYIWELVGHEYFETQAKPHLDRCLAGKIERFETERQDASGRPHQLLVRYFPIEPKSDGRRQIVAVITDISELKQAESRLREQSQLLDVAGRIARFGGWRVDLVTQRVRWSDILYDIHGLTPDHQPSVTDGIGFYTPADQSRIREVFTACAESGTPYVEVLQIIKTDGTPVWVRTTGEAVYDQDGRIIAVHGAFQDISAQKSAEEHASDLSQRLQTTLESITDGFFALDREWRFAYLNREAARLLQQPREQLLEQDFWRCFPETVGTRIERAYRQAMLSQETAAFEEYYRPFGTWFEIRAYPSPDGLAVYFQDVTNRHQMVRSLQDQKAELRRSRDRLAELVQTRKALIDSLPAHIALLDENGRVIEVNDRWRRFADQNDFGDDSAGMGANYIAICEQATGDCSEEAPTIARKLRALLDGETDSFSLEYPCHSPDEQRWFRMAANRLHEASGDSESAPRTGAVVMHVDITQRKLAELQLDRLVNRDPLTDLLTRNGFVDTLAQRFARNEPRLPAVLAMFDIKDLRDINDTYGFKAGDQLLVEISRWLERLAGPQGLVGRIAGDEFGIFLPVRHEDEDPLTRVRALRTVTEHHFLDPEIRIEIAIDLGYTLVSDQSHAAEDLLHQAELALFQLRQHGSAPPIAYNAALDHQVHERLDLSRGLRTAVQSNQLELHFQPQVHLASGRVASCEALLRWNHPERGLQPPGVFIPIAEQSQQIIPIGEWALKEACRRLREWQQAGLSVVGMAVNVSLIQFRAADFPKAVGAAIAAYGIAPGAITLEITESVFEDASDDLLAQLEALRSVGVRLALDDFGTGYSSLAYLQRYPFDEIKVDRCFVARILEDPYSRTVLQAVKGIADALNADLIAEGIETEAIRRALLDLGFELGQGYLFSVPLETEDFRWLLERQASLPLLAGQA